MNSRYGAPVYRMEAVVFMFFYVLYSFKTLLLLIPLDDPLIELTKNVINGMLFLFMSLSVFYIPRKYILLLVLLGGVFIFDIITQGNNGLYNYLVLIAILGLVEGIDAKFIMRIIVISNVILFFIIIPFVLLAGKFYSIDLRYNQERFTLGFGSPNTMSQYLIMIYLSFSYYIARYLKNVITHLTVTTVIFLSFLYVIYLSISRTGLGLITLAYLGMITIGLMGKKNPFKGRVVVIYYGITAAMITGSQIWMITNFSSYPITLYLNGILSGRLSLGNIMYQSVGGYPVFNGINIEPYLPIDFNFIKMIFSIGLIFTIILFYLFLRKLKTKEYSGVALVVMFTGLISAFTESYFAVFYLNFSLLLIYCKSKVV